MSQNDETINAVSRAERPSILEDDWPWTGNELPMTDEEEAEIRTVMLFPDAPLIYLYPRLAKAFGFVGALLIHQIHFHCIEKPLHADGNKWVHKTVMGWATWLKYSNSHMTRSLNDLRKSGVVITASFRNSEHRNRRLYRLDYDALRSAIARLEAHQCRRRLGGHRHTHRRRQNSGSEKQPRVTDQLAI
jgi:hypothetical protein